jgi:hypothetical protein
VIQFQDLNKAVCDRYRQALAAAAPKAPLLAEDVRGPIKRPSGKVELDEGDDAKLMASGRERSVTFRLYYYATNCNKPKLENLAVRSAIGEAFLDGLIVDDLFIGIDDGVSFTVADGVLVATVALTWNEAIPEEDAELMENLNYETEVKT